MRNAIHHIQQRIGNLVACSAFLVTDPVGFDSHNQFLNAACHIQTTLPPIDVLHITQQIETEMGRIAKSVNNRYADRIIDIDLLMYNNIIIEHPQLTLPHPNLHTRSFVIVPLAQIAHEVIHPILNKTIGELEAIFLGAPQGSGYSQ